MADSDSTALPDLDPLRARLGKLRRDIRRFYLYDGVNRVVAAGAILAALALAEVEFLGVPQAAFTSTCVVFGAIVLAVAVRYLVYPLRQRLTDEDLVLAIEREYPLLNDRLITALQLPGMEQRHRVSHSPQLVQAIVRQTLDLLDELELDEVLKPGKLTKMGLLAVGASMLLAGTSAAVTLRAEAPPIGFRVVFPAPGVVSVADADRQVRRLIDESNFRTRPASGDDSAVMTELVVADRSPLVVLVEPRIPAGERDEFDLADYDPAEMIVTQTSGARTTRSMMPGQGAKPYYQHVLTNPVNGQVLAFRWQGRLAAHRYRIVVRPAPRIDRLRLTYHAPAHMRPREVDATISISANDFENVTILVDPMGGGAFDVTVPKLDARGRPIVNTRGEFETRTHRFATADEFAARFPKYYQAHMRERVVTASDIIDATEGSRVTIAIETNKPLDPHATLHVFRHATDDAPAETLTYPLEPTDDSDTRFRASFTLDMRMDHYRFQLSDRDGLRQADARVSPIKVQPDLPPQVSFAIFGHPLRENEESRLVCPEGFIPIVIHAEDDFGLSAVRLYYWLNDDSDQAQPVPGFAEEATFRQFPTSVDVPFDVRLSRLDIPDFDENEQVTLRFRVEAEDNKIRTPGERLDDAEFDAEPADDDGSDETGVAPGATGDDEATSALGGQVGTARAPRVTVITRSQLRARIRYILRKEIKPRLKEIDLKQRGLRTISRDFRDDPTLMDFGVPEDDFFPVPPGSAPIRITGHVAIRLQDEIVRTALSLASRLDAIARHYIANDLEADKPDNPEENAIHVMKYFLAIIALPKQDALPLSDSILTAVSDGATAARRESVLRILTAMDRSNGFHFVRNKFDLVNFADLMRDVHLTMVDLADTTSVTYDLKMAGVAREATTKYEQAVAAGATGLDRREFLNRAIPLQEQSVEALAIVLDELKRWEGFDAIRQQLEAVQRTIDDIRRQIEEDLTGKPALSIASFGVANDRPTVRFREIRGAYAVDDEFTYNRETWRIIEIRPNEFVRVAGPSGRRFKIEGDAD